MFLLLAFLISSSSVWAGCWITQRDLTVSASADRSWSKRCCFEFAVLCVNSFPYACVMFHNTHTDITSYVCLKSLICWFELVQSADRWVLHQRGHACHIFFQIPPRGMSVFWPAGTRDVKDWERVWTCSFYSEMFPLFKKKKKKEGQNSFLKSFFCRLELSFFPSQSVSGGRRLAARPIVLTRAIIWEPL